ncbi:hypothetical protein [Neobacillus vireti]
MNIDIRNIEKLVDYDNILVADKEGIIIFFDLADLNVLREIGLRPE